MRILVAIFVVQLFACTKPNPNRCCTDPADCSAHDIPEGSSCADGLVCRGNQCIAETCSASAECDEAAPFCSSGLCGPTCAADSVCPGFGQDASDRFCVNGGCVECAMSSDCPSDRPVCDANACRACSVDADCASGACGDNGACIDEASIVYVDVDHGMDMGLCTKDAPCKTLQFGVQTTGPMRSHIVMAPGTYVGTVLINTMETSAPSVTIHGGGAVLAQTPGDDNANLFPYDVATTVRDLQFIGNGGFGHSIASGSAPCTLRDVVIRDAGGIVAGANLTIEHLEISNPTDAAILLNSGTHLVLDRALLHGGATGIQAGQSGAVVAISNVLVYDTSGSGLDLTGASGQVSFSTVANTGMLGKPGIVCSTGLELLSTIAWTPGQTPISGDCVLNTDIAGPSNVAGTTSTDPMFVDAGQREYHLSSASPAKDLVDSGPATDLDGTPRPQGPRFDIGAYEATN